MRMDLYQDVPVKFSQARARDAVRSLENLAKVIGEMNAKFGDKVPVLVTISIDARGSVRIYATGQAKD